MRPQSLRLCSRSRYDHPSTGQLHAWEEMPWDPLNTTIGDQAPEITLCLLPKGGKLSVYGQYDIMK